MRENGIWLCSIHNRAKSDDVHLYRWDENECPSWATIMLSNIEQDIRSGLFAT